MIELKSYRDKWLAEGIDDFIGFYNREFYCLDNFSSFKVYYQGMLFSTVEEGYQAIGFIETAPVVAERIMKSNSAHMAKKIAHENLYLRRADWDKVKLGIMENLLRAKLEQHEYVRQKLMETRDYQIVEDSPKDSYWGCGPDRKGLNHLGRLWMKLRQEEREKSW